MFTLHGDLTTTQIFQLYSVGFFCNCKPLRLTRRLRCFQSSDAAEPLDSHYYIIEIASVTAHKPSATTSTSTPMQLLRDQAVSRVLELKRLLKGLVDVTRVE